MKKLKQLFINPEPYYLSAYPGAPVYEATEAVEAADRPVFLLFESDAGTVHRYRITGDFSFYTVNQVQGLGTWQGLFSFFLPDGRFAISASKVQTTPEEVLITLDSEPLPPEWPGFMFTPESLYALKIQHSYFNPERGRTELYDLQVFPEVLADGNIRWRVTNRFLARAVIGKVTVRESRIAER